MAVLRSCCCVLVLTLLMVVWCPGTEAQCTDTTYTAPVIPDSFLPFGTAADTNLPDGMDDGDATSAEITLTTPFRYYGYSFSKCFVSVNGLLSFNVAVAGQASTVQFSIDQVIIAPYWADIVLYNNDGSVYYRAITNTASSELQGLTEDIREKYATPFKFTAKQAVVVTWVNVTHKDGDCDSPVSTFQLVLVTDGRYSFVIFNYAGLGWNAGSLPASHPLVGFTVNTEYTHQLPDSGTADVTDLVTTSNVGQNGVWTFRVDTRDIVTKLCEDGGDTLTLSPDVASPQGGSRIQLSGPCVASTEDLKAKIHGTEVDVTRIADHRLELIVPALWMKGEVLLELSRDDGTTYPLTANLLIDLDPDLVPVVTRVDAPSWEMEKDDNSIIWDMEYFDAVNISIFFATYKINDQDEVEEVLYPLLLEVPNNGQADIEVNGLPLLADDDLKLVTFGSILIKESQGASEVTEVRLYSDIHVAMWYVRVFFIELVTRNKLDDTNPILPDVWNLIKNKFQMTNSQNETVIKTVIKNGVIDLCTMWMSLLSQVGSPRCGSGQTNVAVSTPVPCARRQPLSDPGWTQYLVSPPVVECEQTQDRMCFIQSNPTPTGSSQQGCYKMADDKLLEGTVAGRPLSMHPHGALLEDGTKIPWMIGHMVNDVEPMLFCCVWDKSKCDNFRNVRPAGTCTDYEAPARGGGGGDPHLATFDNVRYTFNGHGEFVLVKHSAGLEVDARLEARGNLKASEITAIVSKVNNSDSIEIRASILTGLEVVINGNIQQLKGRSQVPFIGGYMTLTFVGTELKSVVISFTTGEEVWLKQYDGSLNFVIIPLISQEGDLEGLMGDYDGNKSNDFKPPTGAAISPTSTPQQIHDDFGVKWRTAAADSLFTYPTGETHADFQDMDFVPTFQSADIPVPSNCSGDIFCAFDYNVTEDISYALATKDVFVELQRIQYDFNSGRECPVLILDNGGFGSSRMAGDTVTATCVNGYEVDPATSRTRTCQLDLTWSGTDTICLRQARPCDGVVCRNNGTCIEENSDAICKCAVGYVGSLCQEAVTDTKIVIIVGAVVGGLLLVAIIVAVCLIHRTRPDPHTDRSSEIFKDVFGDVDGRYGVPVFRGTEARRKSYNEYSYDNHGYHPTGYGDKRYNVEPRRYTRETNGYRDSRYPHRPDDRGYPNDHSPHSDTEDSIDKIYRGDYEPYPRPDYDTEYTSHIDRRHPSDFDESSGRKHQPPPPPAQVGGGNWLFNAARNVGAKAVKVVARTAVQNVVEGEHGAVMDFF